MMEMSQTINELATALAMAQARIEGAVKDGLNPHFNSKFPTLASVWDAVRSPLTSHGLSVVQGTSADGPAVRISTMLLHTSGQWIKDALTITAQHDTPQGIGSAISYGRRYGLSAMVGVVSDSDDDGEAATARGNGHTFQAPAPPVSAPPADRDERLHAAEPPVGDRGSLPEGAVYIERVDSSPTKNPKVTKYLLTTSAGETFSTIKDRLAAMARAAMQDREPVRVLGTKSRWGLELNTLMPVADGTVYDVNDDDIPF